MEHQVNQFCKFNTEKLSVNESKHEKCGNFKQDSLRPNTGDLFMSRLKMIKSWKVEPVSVARDLEDL